MSTIKIAIEVPDEEIMDAVFYNLWTSYSPWVVEYGYGNFTDTPRVLVKYEAPDGKIRQKTVSAEMLKTAMSTLLSKGYKHCGQTLEVDPEEWDACGSDMVLQQAIFKDVIYG